MQTSLTQTVSWAEVALEALKILGPAVLTLLGSLAALRHQRLSKRHELDVNARMKARELVFNHYQKKLDRVTALSERFSKAVSELQRSQQQGGVDPGPAYSAYLETLTLIVLMAKHEVEGVEDELRVYGLEKKYEAELDTIRNIIDKTWQLEGDEMQKFEEYSNAIHTLTLVQQAALDARMQDLFSEHLPAMSPLKRRP